MACRLEIRRLMSESRESFIRWSMSSGSHADPTILLTDPGVRKALPERIGLSILSPFHGTPIDTATA